MLGAFPWRDYNVRFAILFGSRVTGKVMKGDWDFAVYFSEFKPEYIADLTYALARHLKVREDEVDIVPLNAFDSLPCALVLEVLRNGKVLYYDDKEFFAREWLRMFGVCEDFMVDYEKLNLHEVQINAVRKLLGS